MSSKERKLAAIVFTYICGLTKLMTIYKNKFKQKMKQQGLNEYEATGKMKQQENLKQQKLKQQKCSSKD